MPPGTCSETCNALVYYIKARSLSAIGNGTDIHSLLLLWAASKRNESSIRRQELRMFGRIWAKTQEPPKEQRCCVQEGKARMHQSFQSFSHGIHAQPHIHVALCKIHIEWSRYFSNINICIYYFQMKPGASPLLRSCRKVSYPPPSVPAHREQTPDQCVLHQQRRPWVVKSTRAPQSSKMVS